MKLQSIQLMRAVAALLVLAYHLRGLLRQMYADAGLANVSYPGPIVENGFAGVDLFFVISGFIMVFVTGDGSRGPVTATNFILSRAVRIYPLWWLFAGIFAAYMIIAHGILDVSGLGLSALSSNTPAGEFLIKSLALIPQPDYPVLKIGWTLVHEVYFYIVFALTLLLARRWLPLFLLIWASIIVGASVAGYSRHTAADLTSLAVHPMTLEFILGAFSALAVRSGRRWKPLVMTLIGSAWLVAALIVSLPPDALLADTATSGLQVHGHHISWVSESSWMEFTLEWWRVAMFAPPAAVVIYGLACLEIEGRLRIWRPFVHLGDWSYALYLSHILVLVAMSKILPLLITRAANFGAISQDFAAMLRVEAPGLIGEAIYCGASIAAVILISAISYHLFERPLQRKYARMRNAVFDKRGYTTYPAAIAARVW